MTPGGRRFLSQRCVVSRELQVVRDTFKNVADLLSEYLYSPKLRDQQCVLV